MFRALATLAIILLFIRTWYYQKNSARKRCSDLSSQIAKDKERFEKAMSLVLEYRSQETLNEFIKADEQVYLIEKGRSLTVYSLNNGKRQTMLESQYRKLEKKLTLRNPAYTNSFESRSVFYRLPQPHENCILRIDA